MLLPSSVASMLFPPDMLNVRSTLSTSLAKSSIDDEPSSSKDTSDTSAKTGASLTAFTVTSNVSESNSSPSVTVTVNDSLPL